MGILEKTNRIYIYSSQRPRNLSGKQFWPYKGENMRKYFCKQLNKCDKKVLSDLKTIFYLFLITRLIFFLFLFYYKYLLNIQYDFGSIYLQYDGLHYYDIAMSGYTKAYQYAFFPLFPLSIRFFSLFNVAIIGTLVVNHIMTLAAAYLLYFTGKNILNRNNEISLTISKLWLFSPIAICTNILYSEALFVLLTLSSYYLYKKKRYFLAGICLGLSVATRSQGSMLYFSIFIILMAEIILTRKWKDFYNILAMFIPATTLSCLYPLYLFVKLGKWHYFVDVQFECWGRMKSNFLFTMSQDLHMITIDHLSTINFMYTYISLLVFIYIIFNSLKGERHYDLILYALFSLIVIFATCRVPPGVPSTSFYRYFYSIISIYLLVDAKVKSKMILIINMVLCIFAMSMYCSGGFLI